MGTLADRIGTSYARRAVRPRNGADVFYRYKLYEEDGTECGEAHYAFLVKPGETIVTGAGRKLRVIDVVPVDEEDSPYVGFLKVELV
jgi:hypothetical protein